jgi:hypothetical protein
VEERREVREKWWWEEEEELLDFPPERIESARFLGGG